MELLLKKGADVTVRNSAGKSALDIANDSIKSIDDIYMNDLLEIISMLKKADAK